jgi:predicted RNase H-like nuclease (RuvC/YqgF family)
MFGCFGTKNKDKPSEKSNNKYSHKPSEIISNENSVKNLKNELSDLKIDIESYKLQNYILEDVLTQYKNILDTVNGKRLDEMSLFKEIENLIMKENFNLKQSYESLTGSAKILEANVKTFY